MKMLKTIGLTLALVGLVTASRAVPITGSINFASDANATLNNVPSLATQVTSWGNVSTTGGTGAYSGVGNTTVVTYGPTPWTFGAVGTTGPNVQPNFWSFTLGGLTYAFDLASLTLNQMSGSQRTLEGLGTLRITGLDDTPGFWSLSTSGTSANISFSAFNQAVPDGGSSIALLGVAMIGLAALRRRIAIKRV